MNILLIESHPDAADIMCIGLRKSLQEKIENLQVRKVPSERDCRTADIAIINHNQHDDSLGTCRRLKQQKPTLPIVVICAPGESMRTLQQQREQTGLIDTIETKPVQFPQLARTLLQLHEYRQASAAGPGAGLQRYLPGSVSLDELRQARAGDALLTERTILYAAIRPAPGLLPQHSPDSLFARLNHLLSAFSRSVEQNRGEVIKYSGDGMLAVFEGFARRYLGWRCARELLATSRELDPGFHASVGLSDGLVMLGFVGSQQRLFLDVIGSNVNVATRLGAAAGPGQLLATPEIVEASGLSAAEFTSESLPIEGLARDQACHRYIHQEPRP